MLSAPFSVFSAHGATTFITVHALEQTFLINIFFIPAVDRPRNNR